MKRPSDSPHPDAERWIELAAGAKPGPARAELDRHARRCAACRALRDAAQVLVRARRGGEFEAVPAGVRQAARAAFLAWRARRGAESAAAVPGRGVVSALRRALGRLRVVMRPLPAPFAPAGVRGASPPVRAQLEGAAHRVELEWRVEGAAWALRGRVLADAGAQTQRGAPSHILLEFGDGKRERVTTGAHGFFGPITASSPEVRLTLLTRDRSLRSPWLPRAPRAPRRRRP